MNNTGNANNNYSEKSSSLNKDINESGITVDNIQGMPDLNGLTLKFVKIIGILVSILSIYELVFGNFQPALQRPLHLFLMFMLTFIMFPSGIFKKGSKKEGLFNLILIFLLFASCLWVYLNWNALYRNPYPSTTGIVLGIICIILVLEGTRRAVGLPMTIIGLVMILYCFLGPYMPVFIAHPGYSLENVVVHIVAGTEGMMGLLLSISVNQIIFFMMFAAFLIMSGSTKILMNLAKALAGSYQGGPAKVAVLASGFMGMISGSASGNTATTGSITIPLMISMGFKRHIAAAIEAVSSTAGQFMPPIMGASAFVIAEYTGVGYWKIAVAAFVPSVIYYIAMFFVVDIQSRKAGLKGLSKSELPSRREAINKALLLLIPLSVLVFLLISRYSPQWAILMSLGILIIISFPLNERRIGLKKILNALALTAKILIPIATSCATAGMIVGVMSLTGLGPRLSYGIITVSGGNLFIGLLFTACLSIILGMGLPTLGAYVILATLGAPALHQLGAPILAAHLFIFYFAIISAITPPVCLSAYVAAGIAGAKPFKTGFTAMRMAPILYVIPFMFVYRPGILLNGNFSSIILNIFEILLMIIPLTVLSRAYFLERVNLIEVLLFCASFIAIIPLTLLSLPWAIIFQVLALILHLRRHRKNVNSFESV